MPHFILNLEFNPPIETLLQAFEEATGLGAAAFNYPPWDKVDTVAGFDIQTRDSGDFRVQYFIYCPDKVCAEKGLGTDLDLALPMAKALTQCVIISDPGNNPYQWLLVQPNEDIFVVSEVLKEDDGDGFFVDRTSMQKVTPEKAHAALRDRYFSAPGDPLLANDWWK